MRIIFIKAKGSFPLFKLHLVNFIIYCDYALCFENIHSYNNTNIIIKKLNSFITLKILHAVPFFVKPSATTANH